MYRPFRAIESTREATSNGRRVAPVESKDGSEKNRTRRSLRYRVFLPYGEPCTSSFRLMTPHGEKNQCVIFPCSRHGVEVWSRAQARATLGGEFPICALSVAQRDPSSTIIHVSCALSKIPYVGFSPVRLQEQVVQVKPATDSHPLKPYPTYRFRRHLYFTLSSDHDRCTYTRQLCFCRLRQCPTSASACS